MLPHVAGIWKSKESDDEWQEFRKMISTHPFAGDKIYILTQLHFTWRIAPWDHLFFLDIRTYLFIIYHLMLMILFVVIMQTYDFHPYTFKMFALFVLCFGMFYCTCFVCFAFGFHLFSFAFHLLSICFFLAFWLKSDFLMAFSIALFVFSICFFVFLVWCFICFLGCLLFFFALLSKGWFLEEPWIWWTQVYDILDCSDKCSATV